MTSLKWRLVKSKPFFLCLFFINSLATGLFLYPFRCSQGVKKRSVTWNRLIWSIILRKHFSKDICKKFSKREKCPYLEFFWSVLSRIWEEYREMLRISPYSVRMPKNYGLENLRIRTLFPQCSHTQFLSFMICRCLKFYGGSASIFTHAEWFLFH